jgi:hypothetical protein
MGFFSKKNDKNTDKKIEGYVQACGNLYNLCVSMYPDNDPHEHLVIVLCTIWTRSGVFKETEIDKPTQAREIVAFTLFPACLSSQTRARVLAYKLIMEDKELSSRFSTEYPEYYKEYIKASKSIWDAKKNGSLIDLYSRYNKNKLHQMMLFPTCNNHEKEKNYAATQNDKYLPGNIVSEVSRMIGQVSKTVTQQRITLCI